MSSTANKQKARVSSFFYQYYGVVSVFLLVGVLVGVMCFTSVSTNREVSAQQGKLFPTNVVSSPWDGEVDVKNVNPRQRKLSDKYPVFRFAHTDISNRVNHVLHIYIDFNDTRSTTFFATHAKMLQNFAVEQDVAIHVSVIQGGNSYGMYASEAIAEAFAVDSSYAWDFLTALCKEAPVIKERKKPGQVGAIERLAQKNKVHGINHVSITNGTFVSWLMSIDQDPNVHKSWDLPFVLLDDDRVALDNIEIFDSNAVKEALVEKI